MPKVYNPGSYDLTVLQVIPELNAGGAERTCLDVAAALAHSGGVGLVASKGGRLEEELQDLGGHLKRLPVHSKNPITMILNIFRLRKIIRQENVAIVHARSRAPAWSAYFAAKMAKVPFVTTYHGTYNAKSRLKRFYNSIMARADVVIANSHFISDLIQQTYPDMTGQVVVIHRGSDVLKLDPDQVELRRSDELRREWRIEGYTQPIVLLPGRLTRWKGHGVFIDAISKLVKEGTGDFMAVIVGDAQGRENYKAELSKSIRMMQLSDRIRLAEHCEDMPAAYAISDIVVSASTEPEAFGRVAVEAQAMGRPIIATDHGGSAETVLIEPGSQTGWRVKPNSADALGRALQEALSLSPEQRDQLGRRGRANAEANFSVKSMCRKTLNVYKDLVDED
jgi:glycosyltransferase involved in cell wall biosynthesis